MMTQPKDPSRARRWHHARQKDLEEAYGLRFPACFFAMYEFAVTGKVFYISYVEHWKELSLCFTLL